MGIYNCPKCGERSYSANKHLTECPHCGMERLLVINPAIIGLAGEISNAKIIIDRRVSYTAVDVERRKVCAKKSVPLGWFCFSGEAGK